MMMFYAGLFLVIYGHLASASLEQQLALSSASSDLSQKLYQKVALDKPNVIYSPYSIHLTLSMNLLGARSFTVDRLKDILGLKSIGDKVHETYKELIQEMNSVTDVQLYTVNAVFVNPPDAIIPEFIQDTANYYFAKFDYINMSADGGPERPINDYIANTTENMVRDVLEPGTIDDDTVVLFVNTLFFNGTWDKAFDKEQTKRQDFFLGSDDRTTQVDMMHDDNRYIKIKRDNANGVDVAELPFKGGRFSMYIALPQQKGAITDLENLLSKPGKVQELFSGLKEVKVQVAIPKFRTETTLELYEVLRSMGMHILSGSHYANFLGLYKRVYYETDIKPVLNKAVIEVQETGTVAKAATVVTAAERSRTLETFIADHPFVYFLRDNQNGQILFQGKFSG